MYIYRCIFLYPYICVYIYLHIYMCVSALGWAFVAAHTEIRAAMLDAAAKGVGLTLNPYVYIYI